MFNIEVRSKDDIGGEYGSFNSFIKEMETTNQLIIRELNAVGEATALQMKQIIQDSKKRPQGGEPTDLENHINVEYFEDGWGVGDIEDLNENVGYWAAVNWGSAHMVGKRVPDGYFSPGTAHPTPDAFRQGRWKVGEGDINALGANGGTSKGHWSFIVSQPIPPMNYIEQTSTWLEVRIDEINIKK